ncbi:MAG TPA: hypothetical protein VIX17_20290 [Pyrinomonadaceae bacterium]|jgi:hypothetical protein
MINQRLSKKATWCAIAVALPFTLLGSAMWIMATFSSDPVRRVELYGCADPMYHYLGGPLTHIVYVFTPAGTLETSDNWWALPLINALFVAQWIIWAQLIVLVARLLKRIRI